EQRVGQLGMRGAVGLEAGHPVVTSCAAAGTDACGEALVDAIRHEELRVLGPAIVALRGPNLVVAERLAVHAARVLLVGRAVADVAVDDDQRRTVALLAGGLERAGEQLAVVRVTDAGGVPAVRHEARGAGGGGGGSRVA